MMDTWNWTSFVIGGLVTWFLMLVACTASRALERIAGSYPKVEDGQTAHDFGPPMIDEYVERAREEGKAAK